MKEIYICYTILNTIEVPDNYTDEQIKEVAINYAEENGFSNLVNDLEISER